MVQENKELFLSIDKKLITINHHESLPLRFINYTPEVQYGRLWDSTLLKCRGLILDDDNNIVARTITKFFNIEELYPLRNNLPAWYGINYDDIFTMQFTAYEKMDGSLIIVSTYNGQLVVSTKGSFKSDQAIHAAQILKEKYSNISFQDNMTYLLEYIDPINRIVVNYGDKSDLVLLTVIENNGRELSYNEITELDLPFERPRTFPEITHIEQIDDFINKLENFEGLVLHFHNGFRCKIKTKSYINLHRLVTQVTPKRVFEALRSGSFYAGWLDQVPDEFYKEIEAVATGINEKFSQIETICLKEFAELKPYLGQRKAFAFQAKTKTYPGILFQLYDNKDIKEGIWRILDNQY